MESLLDWLPEIRKMARQLASRSRGAEVADLISEGAIGAITAQRRHADKPQEDQKRLALWRSKGAMRDHIRSRDPLTRYQRRQANRFRAGLTDDPTAGLLSIVRVCAIPDIEIECEDEEFEEAYEYDPPDLGPLPEAIVGHKLDLERLVAAIDQLPERRRRLIELKYFQHTPHKDIAADLEVSLPRVKQLHQTALQMLRQAMTALS